MKTLSQNQKTIIEMCGLDPDLVAARMAAEDPEADGEEDEIDACLNHLATATDPETDESLRLAHVTNARDALNRHLAAHGNPDADDDASVRTQFSSLQHVSFSGVRR